MKETENSNKKLIELKEIHRLKEEFKIKINNFILTETKYEDERIGNMARIAAISSLFIDLHTSNLDIGIELLDNQYEIKYYMIRESMKLLIEDIHNMFNNYSLHSLARRQRIRYINGIMPQEEIDELKNIGFNFDLESKVN